MREQFNLNQGQQAAADAVLLFLFSSEKEFAVSGPAGVGKTYLMRKIMTDILKDYAEGCDAIGIKPINYSVALTATTNKAAEVLKESTGRHTSTIHSYLGLKVIDDFKTGITRIERTKSSDVKSNALIFIDEASMVDEATHRFLMSLTDDTCKIIYLGDHCQMSPVLEDISPVYRFEKQSALLTEPMRNANQPALVEVCKLLRTTVEEANFFHIPHVPGVIEYLDGDQAVDFINNTFKEEDADSRILCYTNTRVQEYNGYIRQLRGYPERFVKSEILINNVGMQIGERNLSVEQELFVADVDHTVKQIELEPGVYLDTYSAWLTSPNSKNSSPFFVSIVCDREHYKKLMNYYARQKDWHKYFYLKNSFPDLRQKDASTVYKAQGSTYETVLLDLTNIGKCTNSDQLARMLYVGFSRAKSKVFIYGALPDRLFQHNQAALAAGE